jgi:hypothetical protein
MGLHLKILLSPSVISLPNFEGTIAKCCRFINLKSNSISKGRKALLCKGIKAIFLSWQKFPDMLEIFLLTIWKQKAYNHLNAPQCESVFEPPPF